MHAVVVIQPPTSFASPTDALQTNNAIGPQTKQARTSVAIGWVGELLLVRLVASGRLGLLVIVQWRRIAAQSLQLQTVKNRRQVPSPNQNVFGILVRQASQLCAIMLQ
jgi:hypothetical protein